MPLIASRAGGSATSFGGLGASVTVAAAPSFQSIATVTSSSSFASAEFTSIPATFTHLQIRMFGRNTGSNNPILIEFNSDTTLTNYYHHNIFGSGSAASGQNGNNNNFAYWTETGVTANVFGGYIVNIYDYTSTSKYKALSSYGGFDNNGSGYSWRDSLSWQNSAAITNIKILPLGGGSFIGNSHFALYGIKG